MAAEALRHLVAGRAETACDGSDPRRDRLLQRIRERHGDGVLAVLVYGSYLRGNRDTLLDFYVLMDGYGSVEPRWQAALAFMLSPNVYQVQAGEPPDEARAKYALMTLGRFEHAVRRDFHPYFWARFAQPCGLLYCRDEAARGRIVDALADACRHFVGSVVPRLDPPGLDESFTARELVTAGLGLTYACELRTEPAGRASSLYEHDAAHYDAMVAALEQEGLGYRAAADSGRYLSIVPAARRRLSRLAWFLRRVWGKPKSALRVTKAALTFDGGLDYLLWKIRRHSGEYIEPTERQRRHPLIFGWPLLWRLYRRGAFR